MCPHVRGAHCAHVRKYTAAPAMEFIVWRRSCGVRLPSMPDALTILAKLRRRAFPGLIGIAGLVLGNVQTDGLSSDAFLARGAAHRWRRCQWVLVVASRPSSGP